MEAAPPPAGAGAGAGAGASAAVAAADAARPLYDVAWCWSDETAAPCGPVLSVGCAPLVGSSSSSSSSSHDGAAAARAALAAALKEACADAGEDGQQEGGADALGALLARVSGPLGLPLHTDGEGGGGGGGDGGALAVDDDWESDALDLGYAQPKRREVEALHARCGGRAASVRPYLLNKDCLPAADVNDAAKPAALSKSPSLSQRIPLAHGSNSTSAPRQRVIQPHVLARAVRSDAYCKPVYLHAHA